MAFSVSNIFFLITGLLVVLLLQKMDLHVDLISLCFILYNFAVGFIEPHAAGRAERAAVPHIWYFLHVCQGPRVMQQHVMQSLVLWVL